MIYEALKFISEEINQYLQINFGLSEDKVIIANIVNQDGSVAIADDDKVVLSLINIQEEKLVLSPSASRGSGPVCLNLYILFTTTYSGTLIEEALKFISAIVAFFQGNSVFDSSNGSLDSNIEKLILELYSLDFQEQNNLWASLGIKYTPSVIYKARMVVIEDGLLASNFAPVSSKGAEEDEDEN